MTDKHAHAERRIKRLLNEISWLFNVNNFESRIIIDEKDHENTAAEVSIDDVYQRITIYLYPCFFEKDDRTQRKMILHEMCHTITNQSKEAMYDIADGKLITREVIRKIDERTTSIIENILDGLLQGRMLYARQAYANYLTGPKKPQKRKPRHSPKKK